MGESTYENGDSYDGADLMKLLNPGYEDNEDLKCNATISTDSNDVVHWGDDSDSNYLTAKINNSLYWNSARGLCYIGPNHKVGSCDFTSDGLKDELSKNMIDDHIWTLGGNDKPTENINDGRITASLLYSWERFSNLGKQCVTNSSAYCTDTINHTLEWQGKVGLIYPSDFAYATGGGTEGRNKCLSYTVSYVTKTNIKNWSNTYTTCYEDDWLYTSYWMRTITPRASGQSHHVFEISAQGAVYAQNSLAFSSSFIKPVVYLKSNVTIASGSGSSGDLFVLSY